MYKYFLLVLLLSGCGASELSKCKNWGNKVLSFQNHEKEVQESVKQAGYSSVDAYVNHVCGNLINDLPWNKEKN